MPRAATSVATSTRRRAGVKGLQGPVALGLGAAAVQRHRLHAGAAQLAGEPVGAVAGAAEHDRALVAGDHLRGERDTVVAVDLPEQVAHLAGGCLRQLDLVPRRVLLVPADEHVHLAVERRREQQHLAVGCGLVEYPPHGGKKAHVRHPVGLVDDGDASRLGDSRRAVR